MEETQANYNRNAGDFSRARQDVWDQTEFLVDDYLLEGDKVLDMGCGNGRYFELMKNKEIDYFGVDNSEELIQIAKDAILNTAMWIRTSINLMLSSK